jgi:hypothetical protein
MCATLGKLGQKKIITTVLQYGFNSLMGSCTSQATAQSWVLAMQDVIQMEVLRTTESPSHWKIRWSKTSDGIQIDNIQVQDQVARKLLQKVDRIIEGAVLDNSTRSTLIVSLQHYVHAMELLILYPVLDEDEKELFQDHIDDVIELWIQIIGVHGMSNYIPLLGSGHVLYFLKKYDCLYIYSLQGWEALNNTIQA